MWAALIALVLAVLVTLVWLAGRYEASQVQAELERDTANAVSDLRSSLSRHVQALQALQSSQLSPQTWPTEALVLLRNNRDWLRMEWRTQDWRLVASADSPLRAPAFERIGRPEVLNEASQACQRTRRLNGPAYSSSYFLPQADGLGMEVMELCLPFTQAGVLMGFTVVTYSLQELLTERLGNTFGRRNELSFIEPDGTRLAIAGTQRRERRLFTTQQLVDLPGNTLLLRMDGRRGEPDLFPNVLTALVTGMSIALITVMVLLTKDARRRQKAERDLADALAFRKAMEDSLVTGLRARDLQGRITYVNPAFCEMVGWPAEDLLGSSTPPRYWPPEMITEYGRRQALRLAGNAPPREGIESVFMRRNGERFPVLIFEAPLIDAQGTQTGWMSAILDTSEQRRIEELSRASQERLQATARLASVGEMASLISHELNQPLAAISSYANGSRNLLRHQPALAMEELQKHLDDAVSRIAQQAQRAGQVIKSVHDFVRRRTPSRESVRPIDLLDSVMPLVRLQARKLMIDLEVRVADQLPEVWCDRAMVEQVILNLARNGMQAMSDEHAPRPKAAPLRQLTLTLDRATADEGPDMLAFEVADLGCGIDPDVELNLYTPFFTTKQEGMGLGLSLCRTVVEQHGGQLAHRPNQPCGTIFRFTLPCRTPQGSAEV